MSHIYAGAFAMMIPAALIIFAFAAFFINNLRGARKDRADRERIANAPKPPQRPLPKELRNRRKR
jgi:hypothetical protein